MGSWVLRRAKVPLEPLARQLRNRFQGSRFSEEVPCAWDDLKYLLRAQLCQRLLIELDHRNIVSTDDEKRRRTHPSERGPS